jgi:hypothetical protein
LRLPNARQRPPVSARALPSPRPVGNRVAVQEARGARHIKPAEKLGERIDLVVIAAVGKRQQLAAKLREPISTFIEHDVTTLDLPSLADEPARLVTLGLYPTQYRLIVCSELGEQGMAGGGG